ncbi:MAG: hypothetical protein C4297_07080 [Gemmataceae bacterium]
MIAQDLRQLRISLGARLFYETLQSLLDSGELVPADFSLRQLWEACVGPTHLTLPSYAARQRYYIARVEELLAPAHEADLGINLFQTVTGAVLTRQVMDAYNQTDGLIGDHLVTVERSPVRNEKIPGFTALQGPKPVDEGQPYEEASFGDKFITTVESKKGRLLSITEEAVHFDQTHAILRRAARIGEATRLDREKTIVRGVADADFNAALGTGVYRPNGVLEALYPTDGSNRNYIGVGNTTSGTPYNVAVPLDDWTDLDLVLRYHATQVRDDRHAPEPGEPIAWLPRILLVPKSKELTAWRIVSATTVVSLTGSGNERTEFRTPFGSYSVLASPFLDSISTDDWYLGDFRRQFIWHEIWPIQVFRQGRETDSGFERDIVARFKVRYFGGINALDERFVVKVDGA